MKHLLLLVLVLMTAGLAFSQPGSPDKSFGENGFSATTDFGYHNAIVQQPDGKLVTAGSYSKGGVARFLPDGTLDSAFGTAGFYSGINGKDLALLPDDKILVVGYSRDKNNVLRNVVVRLLPDGKTDFSFGENGFAFTPVYEGSTSYDHIQVEKDGTIVISGTGITYPGSLIPEFSYISFISPDGIFDAKYGDNGRILNYDNVDDNALALQKDGKILVGGYNFPGNQNFVLTRYNEDGTPDASFGEAGTISTDGAGQDFLTDIQIEPDGKIVVGGYSQGEVNYMTAIRYDTQGKLDASFGNGGITFVGFGNLSASALATLIQPDGKIILTGTASTFEANAKSSFALCRLNSNGSVDSSFAVDGRNVTAYLSYNSSALCAVLQKDGKIVLGGDYYNPKKGYSNYLLARYNGDNEQKPLVAKIKRFLHNHGIGWQGLDNAGISYYSVQYSKTGSRFIEKGKVSGSGSTSYKQYDYAITDAGYYRVIAVDRQGYKTFSNKVPVTAADVSASTASVFPNPARDYVMVQGLQATQTANISIKDGSGNVLARGVSSGNEQYRSVLGSNMQPGTYYLNVTTGSKTEVLKFVKE